MPLFGVTIECMSAFRFFALCTSRELAQAASHDGGVHVIAEEAADAQDSTGYVVEQGYVPMLMTVDKAKAEAELKRLQEGSGADSGLSTMRSVLLDHADVTGDSRDPMQRLVGAPAKEPTTVETVVTNPTTTSS